MRSVMARRFCGGVGTWLALAAIIPALAAAGSISGTVTAEGGGAIEGVDVCAWPQPESFDALCDDTDAAGHYVLAELPGHDYLLRFSATRNNLRYVDEFYDDRGLSGADTIHLEALQDVTADATLAEGGSIGGSVTDELSLLPIGSLVACAINPDGDTVRCQRSRADGSFLVNGLPSDQYNVKFETWGNEVNYLPEFWEDASTWAEATDLSVTSPGSVLGIDAVIAPGAEVLGHVSNLETGGDLYGVRVCVSRPAQHEEWCGRTDLDGNYAIRGIPAGTYLVEFGINFTPVGRFAGQYWEGAATAEEADPITIAPPQSLSGINGSVEGWYGSPLPETAPPPGGGEEGDPSLLEPPPPVAIAKPKPRNCKKGFHRKLVKGKKRCVRNHRRHRHRKHR